MLYGKSPTLSWFEESPFLRPINIGSCPAGVFAINCKKFLKNIASQASPERDALDFYCANHLMGLVKASHTQHEQLSGWALEVANVYQAVIERQGTRMLNYMVLITTRESRHLKTYQDNQGFWGPFKKKFGTGCEKFHASIKGAGSQGAADAFLASPPASELGNYLSSLVYIFNEGSFGGGYGGKPWGMIARTLEQALLGQTSVEVMLDTAYTLAHNNGPMFNKGMLYEHYGNELYRILDVQRSGQIPELILGGTLGTKPSKDVRQALQSLMDAKPNAFASEVDWQQVKDLGALKDYSKEIAAQAAKKPKLTKSGHQIVGQLYILPGKAASIFTRKSAA